MATPSPVKSDDDQGSKKQRAEQLAAAVCTSVISVLGRPDNMYRISAVKLWGNRYRVNVQTGADPVSTRISHSYFVATDDNGTIIESIPAITRLY